ncbi:YkgJ family cysteine cluster protein [Fusibacter tunisiensis]|uniref:Fe-S-cluster containining protein n=1 Tax=Fusibacter tunisiensis TaxID=1008308 RepID=A0ABS2MT38_9FIRM|nr:YkgJ family cysteine cluster protein [Fusibacter tunisiensis]MBM7562584.1 Fe-S-cluster containining protein [Fusibacter tunisiensis]
MSMTLKPYFMRLNDLYDEIETGTCMGCTNCCSESVNMSYLEFQNVYLNCFKDGIHADPERLKRILTYYLFEWVKPMKCPMLDLDGRCAIYAYRPLPCRLYGNLKSEAYGQNMQGIRRQNLKIAKDMALQYGLLMPIDMVKREIPFCETYESKAQLSYDAVLAYYDRLINLDGELVFKGIMKPTQFNKNLVGWFMDACFDEISDTPISRETLYALRFDILKALQLRRHLD